MNMLKTDRSLLRCLAGGALALGLAWPAHAVLTLPIALTLSAPGGVVADPTPIDLSSWATAFTGITAGDGSDIGGFMLPDETIFFSDSSDSIFLRVAAGDDNDGTLTTGILGLAGTPASYTFSGLNVDGQIITGLNVYAFDGYATSGFTGVISGTAVTLVNASTVRFDLDSLVFKDRGGGSSAAYGEFRIDLITTPIPEPGTWALFALGLAAVGALRARRA
jgi:PEP-CTERM motif